MNLFAQATNVPRTGASNAADFQPTTRNPQSTGGGLQQGTVSQNASGQDVLSRQDTRIIVPTNQGQTATPPPVSARAGGGINWFLVIAIAAVIVVAFEYIFRRRERKPNQDIPAIDDTQEVVMMPADEPVAATNAPETPKSKPAQVKKPASKTGAKKKSKSKRKKSRK